jgi:predicted benzoate:H+ symporter BenE
MQKIIDYLEGKKTLISAMATAIWGALYQQHVISTETFQAGAVLGGCLVAVFMRLAIAKQSQPGITVLHPAGFNPTPDDLIAVKNYKTTISDSIPGTTPYVLNPANPITGAEEK